MVLPNEILDNVFLLSDTEDIRNWEHYERLNRNTFLKKKDRNVLNAIIGGNLLGVKYLLSQGADRSVALMYAGCYGQLEIAKYLVAAGGADIHAWNDRALRHAAGNGHLEVVKYLVTVGGADVHAFGNDSLIQACWNGHLEIVKYLVTAGGANVHSFGDQALRYAAESGHLEVVKYLHREAGGNIRAEDNYALRWAANHGHLEIVKYLLEAGLSIDDTQDIDLKLDTLELVARRFPEILDLFRN